MKVLQSRLFEQRVRKFSKEQKLILDEQINLLIENPEIGTEKKGDLKEVFVHKFKIKTIQYLLAYRFNEEKIELIMIGPHQNYYRDLKKYLKKK
ncbi:MAG: type II toxin-antitoxin system RelE/ParE family toxin [Deltaproteobacteria bacterium]|nr:MAG: type II toxin-antitoxin system RelE/ParE family toxin [Deltaproteobacteria bacterium]